MLQRLAFVALLTSASLFACGEDDDGGGSGGSSGTGAYTGISDDCVSIIEACHTKDNGDPSPINDCHQAAHANKSAQCTADKVTCVALCEAAPNVDGGVGGAGGHSHGGAGGHAGEGGHAGAAGHSHDAGAGGHLHDAGAHD